nr:hypothetical protein [Candidatus Sigynarchaeota archaeon]
MKSTRDSTQDAPKAEDKPLGKRAIRKELAELFGKERARKFKYTEPR